MSGLLVVGAVVGASVGLFVLWCWVMNRLDERESRRERERMLARHYGRDEMP